MTDLTKTHNINSLLPEKERKQMIELIIECKDSMDKKQLWRTDTEARFSVLNDAKHPTNASKYWQAVKEQSVFAEQFTILSFNYRRNEIKIKKIKHQIEHMEADDEFALMELEVDLDECLFNKKEYQIQALDRVREIQMWSDIKKELTDAEDFDTENVNTHQVQSYLQILENKRNTLSPASSQPEIMNVLGQLNTLRRLLSLDELPLEETMKELKDGTGK